MDKDQNMPFVSTPFPSEEITPPLTNLMPIEMRPTPMEMQSEQMDNEYPEIYHEIYPLISDAVDRLMAGGYNPTPDMINSLVDAIIKNSGMWYEDDDDPNMAIPVQRGFGGTPYRRRRRGHHNRNTLRDIVRILLLRELFDKKSGRNGGYYY